MLVPGYKLQEIIGVGRTATVYLALDGSGRRVALKVPKAEVMRDAVLGRMFTNEVSLYKKISHPRIAPSYDGAVGAPIAFLAMHYFEDGPMGSRQFPLAESLRILADLAEALAYLHSEGIVHQDVKPNNVFVEGGRGFLADFGAAASESQPWHTAGTPYYMAPELYRGERNTPKSDVYALGVLAFEVLSGARPFEGETLEELQAAHLAQPAQGIRERVPDLPRPAASAIDRALLKDQTGRPTAHEFARSMESALRRLDASEEHVDVLAGGRPAATPGRRVEASAMRAKDEKGSLLGRLFRRKG
ncbi:MAG TPA: serine/threonine-protein kinase [Deinococcales bacterium]|nr:serine/threonine-protein kinase [Deinococcales bacterium]